MSVTYDPTLVADRDKVRFEVGDTVSGAGPRPGDVNFSDQELDGLLAIEGSWQRTVAHCFETLASAWARHVNFSADGTQASQSDIAKQYRQSAETWRKLHGSATATGSVAVIRADGYSDDLDNVTA